MNPTAQLLLPEVEDLIAHGRYAELREALHGVDPADVADTLAELSVKDVALAFRVLPRDDAAAAFAYLDPARQEKLLAALGDRQAADVLEAMSPDDRAHLLDELPEVVVRHVVSVLSPETRRVTQAILGYPAGTVGRLMTPGYVTVKPGWTVAEAMDHIRRHGKDAETINVVYVVDEEGKLVDDLRLRALLLADPVERIENLMNRSYVKLRATEDESEAVRLMTRYDRAVLPVVDSRGVLIGIVTSDDVADVAQRQATEEIHRLGGVEALDAPYMKTPLTSLVIKRGKWLAALFLGEMLTASAMTHYNSELEHAVVLGLFLPLIISSGGNSGGQATTLIIRALALQEVEIRDWTRVFWRELAGGLALGLFLALIGLVRILAWRWIGWGEAYGEHYVLVGLTVALALVGVVLWGSLMGSMLPFALRALKLDPAAISAPLVATLVDVTGLVIYFSVASIVLRGTLL
ncbi:MAG: magnesium transporter MgtE [Phycisphaerae bacterium]|nr:MAG: magnesium transporter MgtE [Phycisphaerae bacterium]